MDNKKIRINDSYQIVRGIEERGYTPNNKSGGFSNLCGNNAENITPPPKDYGPKTIE